MNYEYQYTKCYSSFYRNIYTDWYTKYEEYLAEQRLIISTRIRNTKDIDSYKDKKYT